MKNIYPSDLNPDSNLKKLIGTETGFICNDEYFEELKFSIQNQTIAEFNEIDITIGKTESPFIVPNSTFENLKSKIIQSVSKEFKSNLPNVDSGFEIPNSEYFEIAKFHILSETSGNNKKIYNNQSPFPEQKDVYFEQSKNNILLKTIGTQKPQIQARRFSMRLVVRYASIAAVLLAVFGLGYLSNRKQPMIVYNNHGNLSAPVFIEDLTYEELQAAVLNEDFDAEELSILADAQDGQLEKSAKQNVKSSDSSQKTEKSKPSADQQINQQIEKYLQENIDDINIDEL